MLGKDSGGCRLANPSEFWNISECAHSRTIIKSGIVPGRVHDMQLSTLNLLDAPNETLRQLVDEFPPGALGCPRLGVTSETIGDS